MQNDGQLSGDGNLGFAQPASLRKSDAPGFERRPLRDTSEQHVGCFVEITAQHLVAALRDSTCPVDLARCEPSGCQSDIGSDAPRPLKAGGVIDRRKEAKSRDCADARRQDDHADHPRQERRGVHERNADGDVHRDADGDADRDTDGHADEHGHDDRKTKGWEFTNLRKLKLDSYENGAADVEISGGGDDVVVDMERPDRDGHEDVYVVLRDAFDAAKRQLQQRMSTLRGDTKRRETLN